MSRIWFVFIIFSVLFYACENSQIKEDDTLEDSGIKQEFVLPELPKSVRFCHEQVALDNFDIKERLDKELIVNTYYHSSTIQSFKRSNRYFPQISRILEEEGVPDDFKYLCLIESSLLQAVSPSGAKGFWQFMPKTAKEYGLVVDDEIDERLHIEKSTRMACRYLKESYELFGDWLLAAASYNRGKGGISEALAIQEVDKYVDLHLPNETSRYVFRILALKLIFENPEKYGFQIKGLELYSPINVKLIEVNQPIDNLMKWSKEKGTNYRMVKLLNPWILNRSISSKHLPITIAIPE